MLVLLIIAFGVKLRTACLGQWCKIHTGPLWCVDTVAQSDVNQHGVVRDPIKVHTLHLY